MLKNGMDYIIFKPIDANIPVDPCYSSHPILGCSWKFSCVIRHYLNVEQLNTNIFILKLKCLSFPRALGFGTHG